ncbi:MAG: ABC transporter permease [Phycisphaerales bacterium]
MFGQAIAIARNTFIESVRQPIFIILVLLSGVFQVFNTLLSAYSMGFSEEAEVYGDDKMLLDMGLATVMVCATTLAAFIATAVLSEEIENKTVLTVVSKPVGRPLFVLSKYLGVVGAILLSLVIMLCFFFLAIRHGVMSTARDQVDLVVVLFGVGSVLLAAGLGVWGNFFYGWVFSSTTTFTLAPLLVIGYAASLVISPEWTLQPIGTEFKPQIMLAAYCVGLAMMVLTALALACSTKLGQVMTIVVCAGFFMLGLLSNHLLGRYAFENTSIGTIAEVRDIEIGETMRNAGDNAIIRFERPPTVRIDPGDRFFFGPDPSGIGIVTQDTAIFDGDPDSQQDILGAEPALIYQSIGLDREYTIINAGGLNLDRLPTEGDFVFQRPTQTNLIARTAWGVIPNLQSFWLVDAITQGHPVPTRYVAMVTAYGGVHVVALLSIAVALFQRRDVG